MQTLSTNLVQLEIKKRTATIWINRPDKRNALNPEVVEGLKEAVRISRDAAEVKIILLKGRGDVFCAGADLAVIKALKSATYEENLADSESLGELFSMITSCPKPVIAAVHGHAIAGGCGLATVCDLVIAAESAKFGYTETRIGFVPAMVARYLIKKTGETRARHLLFTGGLISATEAERIGLISQVAPDDTFEESVKKLVNTLLSKTSGEALNATKKLMNEVSDMPADEALKLAASVNARARGTEDCQKGISAFLNKEKIEW